MTFTAKYTWMWRWGHAPEFEPLQKATITRNAIDDRRFLIRVAGWELTPHAATD
jgi:hypothetical protein